MTESIIPSELLSSNSQQTSTSSVKDQDSLIFWYPFDRGTAFTLVLHCLLILRLLDSQWGCVLVLRPEDWFSPSLYTSVGMFFCVWCCYVLLFVLSTLFTFFGLFKCSEYKNKVRRFT